MLAGADEGIARYLREVGALAGEMQAGDYIGAEAFGIGAEQQHFLRNRRQHLLELTSASAGGGATEPQQQWFNGNRPKAEATHKGHAHADQWGQESESLFSLRGSHRATLPGIGVSLFILEMKLTRSPRLSLCFRSAFPAGHAGRGGRAGIGPCCWQGWLQLLGIERWKGLAP